MICFPNCKINLGLSVTEKRTDGYHNLETVFLPIALHDALEFLPSSTLSLSISGQRIPGDTQDNIVLKAYRMLCQEFPHLPPLQIALLKQIPSGAGLGGGSADASFMLSALNRTFSLNLSSGELEAYALRLGSDCPFFIRNTPQFAIGRGEHMEPMEVNLSSYNIVLVNPGLHIPTGWAFSQLSPAAPNFPVKEIVSDLPVTEWKNRLVNDFEKPVFSKYPELAAIKEVLYEQGSVYASMSGSGSTLFGLFDRLDFLQQKKAERLQQLFGSYRVIVSQQLLREESSTDSSSSFR